MNLFKTPISILLFTILLSSCNLFSPKGDHVNKNISSNYRYSVGKRSIYFWRTDYLSRPITITSSFKLEDVDAATFQPLTWNIGKDKRYVFLAQYKQPHVDAKTFHIKAEGELCDKDHVYGVSSMGSATEMTIIDEADPATFSLITVKAKSFGRWAKDKAHYFYKNKKGIFQVVKVDFDSFELINYYFTKDKDHLYLFCYDSLASIPVSSKQFTVISKYYVYDNKNIYYAYPYKKQIIIIPMQNPATITTLGSDEGRIAVDGKVYIDGNLYLDKPVDIATFTILSDKSYCKDKNRVFYKGEVIPEANAKSFDLKGHGIYVDSTHVFYRGKIVEGVNPVTIKSIGSTLSKDDRYVYKDWKIVSSVNPAKLQEVEHSQETYFTDGMYVYYNDSNTFTKIEGADPKTFTYDSRRRLGKDANAVYWNGVRRDDQKRGFFGR